MERFVWFVLIATAALYVMAAVGYFTQGKWELGCAFLAYAFANIMFARL